MEEFSKFSISDLNTGVFIIDEFLDKNSPNPSLEKFRDSLKKEIERRTTLGPIRNIEDLKTKYLGKYVGYKVSDEVEYFRVDNIEYIKDLDIITIGSKLTIVYSVLRFRLY